MVFARPRHWARSWNKKIFTLRDWSLFIAREKMNLEEKRHRNKSSYSGIFLFYSLSVAKWFVSSVPGFPNSLSSFIYSKRKNIIWVTRLGRGSRFDRWNTVYSYCQWSTFRWYHKKKSFTENCGQHVVVHNIPQKSYSTEITWYNIKFYCYRTIERSW